MPVLFSLHSLKGFILPEKPLAGKQSLSARLVSSVGSVLPEMRGQVDGDLDEDVYRNHELMVPTARRMRNAKRLEIGSIICYTAAE
jgi:hypothetical protein